ncbi:cupin domain-containing protein [Streptomyces sp. NPDC002764]|uniref:cupin domain-containing protein n=1 Tax=Streptomyces sp. NPDC002764 TaxID=3154428 RepID=UPI00333230D1
MIRACFHPPWVLRVEDRAPPTVMLMVRGGARATPDAGQPVRLRAGDLALARGPDPHTCGDDPGTGGGAGAAAAPGRPAPPGPWPHRPPRPGCPARRSGGSG